MQQKNPESKLRDPGFFTKGKRAMSLALTVLYQDIRREIVAFIRREGVFHAKFRMFPE